MTSLQNRSNCEKSSTPATFGTVLLSGSVKKFVSLEENDSFLVRITI